MKRTRIYNELTNQIKSLIIPENHRLLLRYF